MSGNKEKNNIFLVGFMGAGKSTVGKVLSKKLQKPFFDLDIEIASFCKSTIKDIFKNKGEDFFRDTETNLLKEVSITYSDAIVSTGGGVVLKDENWDIMHTNGKVVYLKADIKNIWERIKNGSSRPLLNVDNAFDEAVRLLSFREQFYNKADIVIETDGLSVDQVAVKIEDQLNL